MQDAAAGEEDTQCVICLESGAPPATCACSTSHLHPLCQLRAMRATGKANCTVCLQPYANVRVRPPPRGAYRMHTEYRRLLFLVGSVSFTASTASVLLVLSGDYVVGLYASLMLFAMSASTLLAAAQHARIVVSRGTPCWVSVTAAAHVVVVGPL